MRPGVDRFGMVLEGRVYLDHFAAHGRKELRDSLHRLDGPERLACRDRASRLRQLDIDDVAELFLGEIGDADFGNLA